MSADCDKCGASLSAVRQAGIYKKRNILHFQALAAIITAAFFLGLEIAFTICGKGYGTYIGLGGVMVSWTGYFLSRKMAKARG